MLGKSHADLTAQRILVVGAGSAGMGVVTMIAKGMQAHGLTPEAAAANFHVIDDRGLITTARECLPPHVVRFARSDEQSTGGVIDGGVVCVGSGGEGTEEGGVAMGPSALRVLHFLREVQFMPLQLSVSPAATDHQEACWHPAALAVRSLRTDMPPALPLWHTHRG